MHLAGQLTVSSSFLKMIKVTYDTNTAKGVRLIKASKWPILSPENERVTTVGGVPYYHTTYHEGILRGLEKMKPNHLQEWSNLRLNLHL